MDESLAALVNQLQAEVLALRQQVASLQAENAALRAENAALREENDRLRKQLALVERQSARQAAPFQPLWRGAAAGLSSLPPSGALGEQKFPCALARQFLVEPHYPLFKEQSARSPARRNGSGATRFGSVLHTV